MSCNYLRIEDKTRLQATTSGLVHLVRVLVAARSAQRRFARPVFSIFSFFFSFLFVVSSVFLYLVFSCDSLFCIGFHCFSFFRRYTLFLFCFFLGFFVFFVFLFVSQFYLFFSFKHMSTFFSVHNVHFSTHMSCFDTRWTFSEYMMYVFLKHMFSTFSWTHHNIFPNTCCTFYNCNDFFLKLHKYFSTHMNVFFKMSYTFCNGKH